MGMAGRIKSLSRVTNLARKSTLVLELDLGRLLTVVGLAAHDLEVAVDLHLNLSSVVEADLYAEGGGVVLGLRDGPFSHVTAVEATAISLVLPFIFLRSRICPAS